MKQTFKTIAALTGLILGISFSANAQSTNWLTAGNTVTVTPTLGITTTTGAFPLNIKNASTTQPINFWTAGTQKVTILSNGNVGINFAAPTEKLQINNGILKLSSPNPYGGAMMLFAGTTTTSYVGDWGIEYASASAGYTNTGLNFWKPFGSPNWGNNYLFLADNGHVGVNTNNPTGQFTVNGNVVIGDPAVVCIPNTSYKLFVQTGILTEKVKVAVNCSTDWADYVFDEKYNLENITALENYVKANKHLPNIPSAEEVVKSGIDLGGMDAKLLGKIEELTLYLIQQNKKIEQMQTEITSLKTK